jgi:hypothetical protein
MPGKCLDNEISDSSKLKICDFKNCVHVLKRSRWKHLYFFSLWLYSPILGLGRLHETFRFISVTRSRTVSRTPWTGDQLVARLLLVCPGWLWKWWSWWNERFWQGKPKYSEETCPDATLPTTNPTCQTRARTRAVAVESQRLTASATVRPKSINETR